MADYKNSSFKIIDLENKRVGSNIKHKNLPFRCIKKVNHPIYGESLFLVATIILNYLQYKIKLFNLKKILNVVIIF